ncbi:hypothetical protein RB601_007101 [Gaeumannomyces tritici]
MRSVFRRRAISPCIIQPHLSRRSSLLASRILHPVPKPLAAQSIPTVARTITSSMAAQSEMPEVSASAPKQESSVDMPAAGASTAEEAEAKPAADNGADDAGAVAEPALPPLTPAEFREFNRLADEMTYYHDHFKQSWNVLYDAASSGRRPKNLTLKQFLDTGMGFVRSLTMHHNIEEIYLYPILAPKMAEFRHAQGGGGGKKLSQKQSELIQQHRDIHEGTELPLTCDQEIRTKPLTRLPSNPRYGSARGVHQQVSLARGGPGDERAPAETGFVGHRPVEAHGPGGRDTRGGKHEKVLHAWRNEADPNVVVRRIAFFFLFTSQYR